ncbi:UPF0496 protein [Canna indica]|uniref:UPF0496 protein n=1 Tax=Canna indica TaxID=4628 RepID=A0AAQ3KYH8_9LILI|nr:UPF0496 protein [Canna indica]
MGKYTSTEEYIILCYDALQVLRELIHHYKGDFLEELPGLVDFTVLLNLGGKQKAIIQDLAKFEFKRTSLASAVYIHPDLYDTADMAPADRLRQCTEDPTQVRTGAGQMKFVQNNQISISFASAGNFFPSSLPLMRCFSTRKGAATASVLPRLPLSRSVAVPVDTGSSEEPEEGGGINGERWRGRTDRSPPSDCSVATASTAASPASSTINLSRVYLDAVTTSSYKEIWSEIHRDHGDDEEEDDTRNPVPPSPARLVARVLQPDRESIEEALRGAPQSHLTRLVSDYFESSEHTSHFCLSLSGAVSRARSLYAPIGDLIELLDPAADGIRARLTNAQCDWAFERLLEFDQLGNPIPAPSGGDSCSFQGMRGCFTELKQQLDLHLLKASRRYRQLRRTTRGAAACLIVSTVGIAVTVVVLATHGLVLMAGPVLVFFLGSCRPRRDLLGGSRRKLKDYMSQLDAASRGAFVLDNDLDTIERLVARLHATVESDRVLVQLGLESGRGQQHPIEEVVRQFGKNYCSFLHQLEDLEEHICLFFTAVNRARSLLLRQIQQPPPP